MDSLERNIQQASQSILGKVVLHRMEQWISRASVIEATELPTRDGGVEVLVVMQMQPGNLIVTEIINNRYVIARAMGGSRMASYVTPAIRKALANHRLEVVQEGPVTAYYLKDPTEGRMMSTLLLFTPEGIVLQGDLTPERNGTVSCYGYGIGWFGSTKNEDYLCGKFLERKFVQEAAIAELKAPDSYWRDLSGLEADKWYRRVERLDEIIDDLEADGHEVEWLVEQLEDAGYMVDDGPPGITYEPREAGWLCAIQQRFAELYQEDLARDQGSVVEAMRDRMGQGAGDARAAEPVGALAGDRGKI